MEKSTVYSITNITASNLQLGTWTLKPAQSETVNSLTHRMILAWGQAQLRIEPPPTESEAAQLVTLNPCQLPLPVVFQDAAKRKATLVESILDIDGRRLLLSANANRGVGWLRNLGGVPVFIGGPTVSSSSAWTVAVNERVQIGGVYAVYAYSEAPTKVSVLYESFA